MNRSTILNKIYGYYPKNIDSISDRDNYLDSKEYKKLIDLIEEHKKNSDPSWVRIFLSEAEKINSNLISKNSTVFNWNDRCYTLDFVIPFDHENYIIKFYRSIIIPSYFVLCFKERIINNRQKVEPVSVEEFPYQEIIDHLSMLAKKRKLFKFDNRLLFEPIKNINFEDIPLGEFNFFNAVFANQII